jgi:hypothetical protein
MTNVEIRMTKECRSTNAESFIIWNSSFFRHSCFVIRHFCYLLPPHSFFQCAVHPPSIVIPAPVMKLLASLARKTTRPPISSRLPQRPSGMRAMNSW